MGRGEEDGLGRTPLTVVGRRNWRMVHQMPSTGPRRLGQVRHAAISSYSKNENRPVEPRTRRELAMESAMQDKHPIGDVFFLSSCLFLATALSYSSKLRRPPSAASAERTTHCDFWLGTSATCPRSIRPGLVVAQKQYRQAFQGGQNYLPQPCNVTRRNQ